MPTQHSFDYATVRVVPRVEREEFMNVGVIVFCRSRRFLDARIVLDRPRLHSFAPQIDLVVLERYLSIIPQVCRGGAKSGPIGQLPLAERYHWLVAPRSTIVQTSAAHAGLCTDPARVLDHLLERLVVPLASLSGPR